MVSFHHTFFSLILYNRGNVILWFQQIVLSGIISENKVYLYGYADIEGMDSQNAPASTSNATLNEICEAITDESMKSKIMALIKEGKETNSSTVTSCIIESQFQLENAFSEIDCFATSSNSSTTIKLVGVHKKTVTETHKTGDEIKITTTYNVELELME